MTTPTPLFARNLAELTATWHVIDGGHGYSAPQLFWLYVDDDGLVLPQVMQMYDDEFAHAPDEELLANFAALHTDVLARACPGGSLAVMKARPGRPTMTAADRHWCLGLHRHLRAAPYRVHPVFFATDESLGPLPADLLVERSA